MARGEEVTPLLARPAYIVDTSVALKWFVQRGEADVDKAVGLAEAYRRGDCVLKAPELLLIEVANALMKGRRFTLPEVIEALAFLKNLDMVVEGLRWPTLTRAVEVSTTTGVAVYDCLFLAMALESDSYLVTADEAFVREAHWFPRILPLRRLRLPAGRHSP